jgi:F-type H+-transporting ATPase subunit b
VNRFHKLIPIAFSLLASAVAFAEEHGEAAGEAHGHAPEIKNLWNIGPQYAETPALGFLSITFAVFVIGLLVILRPRISILLENRADTVRKAIEEAKRAKEAAEARAREAEQKLASLEDEMKRLKGDFEMQGKAEMERIEKMANEAAARIARDAEDTINAEAARAQLTLRAEAARLALELAEERIKGALKADDEVRLQKALIAGLESAGTTGKKTAAKGGEA